MTLVAYTFSKNFFCIIGDLLISSPEKFSQGSIKIPTLRTQSERFETERPGESLVDLVQKVIIINPKLCVAVAGSVYGLKLLISDLRLSFGQGNTSFEHVRMFVDGYDISEYPISFALFFHEEKGTHRFNKGNGWLELIDRRGMHYIATGSGRDDFFNSLSYPRSWDNERGLTLEQEFLSVIGSNFCLIAEFMCTEMFSQKNLTNKWGAGFEMVHLESGCFHKVNNIAYVLLSYILNDDGSDKFLLHVALYYHYVNDTLFLIDVAPDKPETTVYRALPLDQKFTEIDAESYLKQLTLNIEHLATCTACHLPGDKHMFLPSYHIPNKSGERSAHIYITEEGTARCILTEEYMQNIREWVKKALSPSDEWPWNHKGNFS